ncbi:trithorax group protein osa-like isoform X3 [Eriocheir sinensis]|uniref:trithorax group protein osa-like isoform X3 n=1 Tax=Eriocheir sinensis TaxID=95602 RepID=UPI0021C8A423|nr:trithorax group protein osa-like isoform X3 [Eriocheir sinensis]
MMPKPSGTCSLALSGGGYLSVCACVCSQADEGGDDPTLRGRHPHHPHFRVPSWLSDDQDMKDLAARMSHAPHFATLGRRGGSAGPWRERRHSGGSAMSGTSEDDTFDPSGAGDRMSQGSSGSCEQSGVPHEIPIRFEAPPPPSQQQQPPVGPPTQGQPQEGEGCMNNRPTRTTSAVDATEHGTNSGMSNRNSRCASAPPEMAEQQQGQVQGQEPAQNQQQQPQRFVSKISITPQAPTVPQPSTSPQYSPLPAKFNTVPRPFVSPDPQHQYQQPQQQYQQPQQQYQQPYPQQYPQQPPQQQYQAPPHPQQQQQPPLGFYPPQPQPEQQWQFGGQQQYPPQQYPQQEPQRGGQRPSVVRNIPIFVEGRDDPIDQEPRPAAPPQWTQTRPQPQQQPQPHPQPRPVPQQPQQQPQPQPMPRQKRQQAHQPTPPPQQPIPHPVPMPMPEPHGIPPYQNQNQAPQQPQPQQPQPQEAPPPEPQPSVPKDPRMAQIERVSATVKDLVGKVEEYKGGKKDREFLYLDEMLTRALLELDNVDPDGCDDVRQARRTVIKGINAAISKLEEKATTPLKEDQNTQPPPPPPPPPTANQDPAAPPPTTPTPGTTTQEGEKTEKSEEKMETDQKEAVKSGEPAEGSAETAPAQPEVSSS